MEHFAFTLLRDAQLEGYCPAAQLRGWREVLPGLAGDGDRARHYAARHAYQACPLHPHALRNYVLPPVYRGDRESPLLLADFARALQEGPEGTAFRDDPELLVRSVALAAFVRRCLHNWPPGWAQVHPVLLGLLREGGAGFDPCREGAGGFAAKLRSAAEAFGARPSKIYQTSFFRYLSIMLAVRSVIFQLYQI